MNKILICGRLTRDPEVRNYVKADGSNGTTARFTVAVDRVGKDAGADFIPCTAFGKTAEFIEKYTKKGTKVLVEGRFTTGSYDDKDGNKKYTYECTVERIEFAESKSAADGNSTPQKDEGQFLNVSDSINEELPF